MSKAYIEYCIDGYNDIVTEVGDLRGQLQGIKEQTANIFGCPFAVDIVIDGAGIMSIGLAENTVLCFKSADLETQLTALGDPLAEGTTVFYFGDHTLMSDKYLIPYETALKAVEYWLTTGSLSPGVNWTDKLYYCSPN